MTAKVWSQDEIKEMLSKSDMAVEHAVVAIFKRQTDEEQRTMATHELNHIGFNAFDAELLSSFAEQVAYKGRHFSSKQMAIARKRIVKYVKQLTEIANGGPSPVASPMDTTATLPSSGWTKFESEGRPTVYAIDISELQDTFEPDVNDEILFPSPDGSGDKVVFNALTAHRDPEGDIMFWQGAFGNFEVKVFND